MITRKKIADIRKWCVEMVEKELYVALLADGRDFCLFDSDVYTVDF